MRPASTGFGQQQAELLRKFPNTHVLLALMRDGFHRESPGGKVKLRGDGSPVLDYPLTDFVMDGARRAMLAMAEIQFAAGARQVLPVHELARPYAVWAAGQAGDRRAADEAAADQGRQRARDGWLRRWRRSETPGRDAARRRALADSTTCPCTTAPSFPTSIGANPQLSIYGITNRLAQALAKRLSGQDVILA